jgi:hypothetical protein
MKLGNRWRKATEARYRARLAEKEAVASTRENSNDTIAAREEAVKS